MNPWKLHSADGKGKDRRVAVEANCLTASGGRFGPSPLSASVLISRY